MQIERARQMLKALADDTRLRIVNLLNKRELSVSEICRVLAKKQPNVSKHLARLRLLGIVGDRRKIFNVYYYLNKPRERIHKELLKAITVGLADLGTFKKDLRKFKELQNKQKVTKKGGGKK